MDEDISVYGARGSIASLRSAFDRIYDDRIVSGGFFESDEYYRNEKERYWRTLQLLSRVMPSAPARVLEIGGGQIALLCKELFGDDCTVGDISEQFIRPIRNSGIGFLEFDLIGTDTQKIQKEFDIILLLEVVEHIPLPVYVIMEKLKPLVAPGGLIFLTTPNLFRLRNLARMLLGTEFLDRFMLPTKGRSLGHQLEYSADHLKWQLERASLDVVMLLHDSLGRKGHSRKARLARRLMSPLEMRPIWRDSLIAAAKKQTGKELT
jgi:2-polyprenyl-3-methyl-5-hydroxy-6-metoxy-1,4-benzoquinol methylase